MSEHGLEASTAPSSQDARTFWLGTLVLAVLAAISRLQPVADPDTPWHLSTAAEVLTHRSWSYADTSSFTMPNAPFTAYPWLGSTILYALFRALGWDGLVLFGALCAAGSAVVGCLVARRAAPTRPLLALLGGGLAAGATNFVFEPRPQALFLVALGLAMLWGEDFARATTRRRRITTGVALLALQILWSHVHSSSILLAPVVALALLDARGLRGALPWAWVPAALFAALLLGPGGPAYFAFVFDVATGDATKHIAEMMPMKLGDLFPQYTNSVLWLDLLLGLALVRTVRLERARPADVLRAIVGVALVFSSRRFRAPWALLVLPWAVRCEADAAPTGFGVLRRLERPLALLAVACVLPLTISNNVARDPSRGFGLGRDRDRYPVDAAQVLGRAPAPLRLFNEYDDGGFLEHEVGPAVQIAIDGRTPTLFDSELYFLLRRALSEPTAFAEVERRWSPDAALIYRKAPLCAELARSAAWRTAWLDERRALFVRRSAPAASALPSISVLAGCDPEAAIARTCAGGQAAVEAARNELDALPVDAPYVEELRARLELACGHDTARAKAAVEALLGSGTRRPAAHVAAADVLLALGALDQAAEEADLAVALGAEVPGLMTRARIAEALGADGRALEDLAKITSTLDDLTPPETRISYARILDRHGRRAEARIQAQRAAWTSGSREARELVEALSSPTR